MGAEIFSQNSKVRLLPQSGGPQVAPGGGLGNSVGGLSFYPLSRAEHRHGGRDKRADLSEQSEFPRAPHDVATRRVKRDTGGFFWFVF